MEWGATALAWAHSDPDLCVQWKANSPAKVQSRWVQWSHSRLVAMSIRRFQKPLPNLRYPSNHSCMSRLGTPSTGLQARIMHWNNSTLATQGLQGLRSTSALSTSIVGTLVLSGLATLPRPTCWLCTTWSTPWKELCGQCGSIGRSSGIHSWSHYTSVLNLRLNPDECSRLLRKRPLSTPVTLHSRHLLQCWTTQMGTVTQTRICWKSLTMLSCGASTPRISIEHLH